LAASEGTVVQVSLCHLASCHTNHVAVLPLVACCT